MDTIKNTFKQDKGKSMKKVKVTRIPACDFCGKPAKYDAPTLDGRWGNMCVDCYGGKTKPDSIGSEYVLHVQQPKQDKTVQGTEESSMEEIVFAGDRMIGCPECGDSRAVEPDADYTYTCECGVNVKCPVLM